MALLTYEDKSTQSPRIGTVDYLRQDVAIPLKQHAELAYFMDAPNVYHMKKQEFLAGPLGGQFSRICSMASQPIHNIHTDFFVHTEIPYKRTELLATVKGSRHDQFYALQDQFKETLHKLSATTIILGGSLPLLALFNGFDIQKHRGSIYTHDEFPGKHFIPTVPLTATMPGQSPEHIYTAAFDLMKAVRVSQQGPIQYNSNYHINPSFAESCRGLETILDNPHIPCVVDIENDRNGLTCNGFSVLSPATPICIPFTSPMGLRWQPEEEAHIWKLIGLICESTKIKKVAQNGIFDFEKYYWEMGIKTNNFWFDTMLAQAICWADLPKSLEYLTSVYTDLPYYKDENQDWKIVNDYDRHWTYNCKDIHATGLCYEALCEELDTLQAWPAFTLAMELHKPLMEMMTNGIDIDMDLRQSMTKELETLMNHLKAQFLSEIGKPDLNPNSPPQLQDYFYNQLKLPVQKSKTTGKPCCDADAIKKFAKLGARGASTLLQYKKLQKMISTYFLAEIEPDNKYRCQYKIAGTETGRLSSAQSINKVGGNMQNIPPQFRKVFVAPANHLLVELDLSQAESRVVAYESGDETMIAGFVRKLDVHTFNASNIYQIPYEELVDRLHAGDADAKNKRYLAKRVVHATNYSMGPGTMANQIGCSINEARTLISMYLARYPKLKVWHKQIRDQVIRYRMLYNCFGRPKRFLGYLDDPLYRSAYAFVPQSTVAECLNRGLADLAQDQSHYTDWHVRLNNTVHDSLQTRIPLGGKHGNTPVYLSSYLSYLEQCFVRPIQGKYGVFQIPCDFKIGFSWGNMVEVASTDITVVEEAWRKVCCKNTLACV